MIDIGVNLFHDNFPHPEKIISSAVAADIKAILIITSEEEDYYQNLQFCKNLSNNQIELLTTIGLHPHRAQDKTDWIARTLKSLNSGDKKLIKAIGECGLDYYRMISPKEIQIKEFEKQILLSQDYDLPLYLHERSAIDDMLSMISNLKQKKIIHCFTGGPEAAYQYLKQDCFFGISSWLCDPRRNQDLINAIKIIPLEKIMLETDSPYLLPPAYYKKFKQKINEPRFLSIIADKIAEIKNIPVNQVIDTTTQNSNCFFSFNKKSSQNYLAF